MALITPRFLEEVRNGRTVAELMTPEARGLTPYRMKRSGSLSNHRYAEGLMIPGEYLLRSEPVEANTGRRTARVRVTNRGDRPIKVGSHFHFFEVNADLDFDRALAYGMRLNVAAGTAVRFEPGDTQEIELVALGGTRTVYGINGLVNNSGEDRPPDPR